MITVNPQPTDTMSTADRLRAKFGDAVQIGVDCDLHADLDVIIHNGAELVSDRVSVRRGTTLRANPGARIAIGDDTATGENTWRTVVIRLLHYSHSSVDVWPKIRDPSDRPPRAMDAASSQRESTRCGAGGRI